MAEANRIQDTPQVDMGNIDFVGDFARKAGSAVDWDLDSPSMLNGEEHHYFLVCVPLEEFSKDLE